MRKIHNSFMQKNAKFNKLPSCTSVYETVVRLPPGYFIYNSSSYSDFLNNAALSSFIKLFFD